MPTPTQALLFIVGCLGIRLLYALSAKLIIETKDRSNLRFFQISSVVIGVSMLYLYITNSRMNAPESSSGKTWWNSYRPLHAMMHLLFVMLSLFDKTLKYAFIPLLLDVIIGAIIYIRHILNN